MIVFCFLSTLVLPGISKIESKGNSGSKDNSLVIKVANKDMLSALLVENSTTLFVVEFTTVISGKTPLEL